jgi:hypothetical protein|tara:strand:- start:6 stop:119 length:114 start_codon:yes stop_codon:yes gene_type:complete
MLPKDSVLADAQASPGLPKTVFFNATQLLEKLTQVGG